MESVVHLTVRAKVVGRRNRSLVPLELDLRGPFATVLGLLSAIVQTEVESFRKRKEEATYFRLLTESEIQDGLESGKIVSGNQQPDERVPGVEQAIETAVSAFHDGLYYMFLNDVQVEDLNEDISQKEVHDVLFVRLTPLAGG